MTEKDFAALVVRQSPPEIVDALLALPPEERRALAPIAADLWKAVDGGRLLNEWSVLLPGASTTRTGSLGRNWREQHAKLSLAVLALCNIDKARRVFWLGRGDADDLLLRRVFAARDPAWRDAWLRHRLRDEFPGVPWSFVRGLVRDGLCRRPEEGDSLRGYLRLMVSNLNPGWSRPGVEYIPLRAQLLADPSLLDDEIWRLFELDTNVFDDAWTRGHPQCPADYESWSDALIGLASEGRVDRRRLLDASLAGVWTSSNNSVLAGYHKLHSRLAPSADELDARETAYRELLGHRTGHVVGFALRQLGLIVRRRPLPGEPTLAAMPPLFALPAKAQPLAALKLVGRLLKQEELAGDLAEAAHAVLCEALRHPASEVQQVAAQFLCAYVGAWSDDQLERVRRFADELAPLARAQLAGLGAEVAAVHPALRLAADAAAEAAANSAEQQWRTRLQALPPRLRTLGGMGGMGGLGGSAGEVDFSRPPPPLAFALSDLPVLTKLPPLLPITSVDELIDGVAHAIEAIDSVDEVERLVDGIARLFDDRPADFAARTQALVKRMYTGALADARGLVLPGAPNGLRDLVLTWLEGRLQHTHYPFWRQVRGPMRFVDRRLRELTRHLDRHGALQPLATPTHVHGWIAPCVLVERLTGYELAGRRPLASDLLQALLRLAPDGRGEALALAGELRGDWAPAVRWALGGADGAHAQDRKQTALWIAAGRARAPHADLSGPLAALDLRLDWPDVLRPASYQWQAGTRTLRRHRRETTYPSLDLHVSPAYSAAPQAPTHAWGARAKLNAGAAWLRRCARWLRLAAPALAMRTLDPSLAVPTCLAHESAPHRALAVGYSAPWLIEWTQILWPLNVDASLALGARLMVERIDLTASAGEPLHAFLTPLFESNRPWSEMGKLALSIALASRDGDLRRLATDLLIEGIADGRADPGELAGVLRRLAAGGWLKANRLSETLGEVARVSPLHQWAVAGIIEGALDVFLAQTGKANVALELLHELLVDLNCGPTAETAQGLSAITSGKAGIAARAIAGLAERPSLRTSPKALCHVWEARLARLDAWALAERRYVRDVREIPASSMVSGQGPEDGQCG